MFTDIGTDIGGGFRALIEHYKDNTFNSVIYFDWIRIGTIEEIVNMISEDELSRNISEYTGDIIIVDSYYNNPRESILDSYSSLSSKWTFLFQIKKIKIKTKINLKIVERS